MTTTIHLKPRLALKRVQVLNDSLPGIILLFSGLETLSNKGFTHDVVPYVSVVLGVFVIRWAIEEVRRETTQRRVKWFDIVAGLVMIVDAVNRYNVHKAFQPAHLLILAGILSILRGTFAEKLPGLRRVVLKDEGIFARTSVFHSFSCSWSDIDKIERDNSALLFILRNGSKRLKLNRAENRAEVIRKISEVAMERGIQIVETA